MRATPVSPSRSKNRPPLPHQKSTPSLHNAAESENKTEDFREVRSKLRKTSSHSPLKPSVKLSPDSQTSHEGALGFDHNNPSARLETIPRKENPQPPSQEDIKPKDSKGKEREAPKLLRTKTDHNKCIEDNGWRPPAPLARDHTKCIEDAGPSQPSSVPKNHNKGTEEPRGRAREQTKHSAKEMPRDHAPRQTRETAPEPAPEPAPDPGRVTSNDHECEWKDKYITLQADVGAQGRPNDIGLEGLTIVLHMQGRDDLVINTDLRNLE